MSSLYELTERYAALFELACDEADDEGQVGRDFVEALKRLEDEINFKLESCCRLWRSLDAQLLGVKTERERLAKRERALENRLQSLKDYLKDSLIANGIQKRQVGIFNLRLQKNSQASVVIEDEKLLPADAFVAPPPQLSKLWIREAIESGKEVPGAYLETGQHVRC